MGQPPSDALPVGFSADRIPTQLACEERLQELPSSPSFRGHLERITCEPHPTGSEANARVGDYVGRAMEKAGLDVDRYPYDAYIPEPGGDVHIALVRPIRLPLNNQEYILEEDRFSGHPALTHGWTGYSGSGDVTAKVVYANYGRREDFDQLREMGISIQGRIVVARYGGNFRGYKAKYAEQGGAVGLIIYSDPANGGYVSGPVYPEGKHLNESAVQRGSLLTLPYKGDPLTPFDPALPVGDGCEVNRLDPAQVALPKIPVAPLPYGSAVEILKRMQGAPVPSDWQGGLPFTYRLTGGADLTVRLRVDQPRSLRRVTNVIGTVEGTEFPDEWIIVGGHYDAWSFGTVDPNSGTAMLLTLAEALGQLAGEGRRPRRTVKIAHWDAEELSIIGSTEWVEQFGEELTGKAVAYLNADMAAYGPRASASGSPSLKASLIDAMKAVSFPGADDTVHARWTENAASTEAPPIGSLGGGSDHMGFYMHLGVPCGRLALSGDAAYHTNYDNLAFYERFCDPEFVYGPAVARLNGILALRFANADVLPYDVSSYGTDLVDHMASLEDRARELGMSVSLDGLGAAVSELRHSAAAFEDSRKACVAGRARRTPDLRAINAALIGLEKAFVHPGGLQERPWHRSLYTAEDPFEGYGSWMLPGLRYEVENRSEEGVRAWTDIYVRAVEGLRGRIEEITSLMG